MHSRRELIKGLAASACTVVLSCANAAQGHFAAELDRIERSVNGRLGVSVIDTASGVKFSHRGGERFPLCSTFKLLAAAAVLRHVDNGTQRLDRRVVFSSKDLVPYSPVTEKHAGEWGMTVAELCEAAITRSDNTAGNLLLASIGGPGAITNFARSLGDTVTRLDRIEPALNEATPGDPRDTTSPDNMGANIEKLVLGNALKPESRKQLTEWLLANQTGGKRLRAKLPAGWRVGDKTGSGEHGSTNDVGLLWPPRRTPIVAAVYLTETSATAEARDTAIADVGKLAASLVNSRQ